MLAGGLMAIFFICTLVVWTMWSLIYVTFASHYFLTTLTDSSSGQDEVQFPREGVLDWWWKPLMCAWVLLFWVVPATLLLSPLAMLDPLAFLIVWTLVLWFVFPLSLSSMLYAQNWLVFVHRGVIGRMLRHFSAFAYVYLLTFAMFAGCLYLVLRGMKDIVWLVPAIVLVPAAQLLYARHWGRFAWLSLNFLPRQTRRPRASFIVAEEEQEAPLKEFIPEMPVEEVEAAAAEAFREGPPPAPATAVQADAPPVKPVKEYDEWTDLGPYEVIDDPLPPFEEPAAPPVVAPTTQAPAIVEEEEDEWAPNKKPYSYVEPAPAAAQETRAEIDIPIVLSKHYDDKAKKEAEDQRRREEEKRTMPPRSKKTPTFQAALLGGVWKFLFYPSTLIVWANLAAFTVVEFLLLYMLVTFYPLK